MELVVRCSGCDKIKKEYKNKLYYLTDKAKNAKNKSISEQKEKRSVLNQMNYVKRKVATF